MPGPYCHASTVGVHILKQHKYSRCAYNTLALCIDAKKIAYEHTSGNHFLHYQLITNKTTLPHCRNW